MKESAESTKVICIVCPKGCILEGRRDERGVTIQNGCPRGQEYAYRELQNPCRIVTTTIAVRNAALKRLPVRTSLPFPKRRIPELIDFLHTLSVEAPVRVGTVLMENLLGEPGVHLVATRTIERKSPSRETERQT